MDEVQRIRDEHPDEADPIRNNRVVGFLEPTRGRFNNLVHDQLALLKANIYLQPLAMSGSSYLGYTLLEYILISDKIG
jgi:hypothetical protein